jgi:hypothetical protein
MLIHGNEDLLKRKLTVILNSSQSKTPCGRDGWIISTRKAVNDLLDGGHTLITSIGLNTWELVLYLAAARRGYQVIVSPYIDNEDGKTIFETAVDGFSLDVNRTAMVFAAPESGSKKPKAAWVRRDKAAISLAEVMVPISIRPGGKLERLLRQNRGGRRTLSDYEVPHERSGVRPPRYDRKAASLKTRGWDYLTHWTRTHHGPWTGQKKSDFYRSLIESKDEYPNNAFNTIRRIALDRTIRASSKRLRAGIEAVAFTESHPAEVLAKMRWLPKRVNWNFEPHGIAIEKKAAQKMGTRPVIYGGDEDYKGLSESDRPYFQSRGRKDVDWTSEKEWRHLGDLDFSGLEDEQLSFLVWSREEARVLEKESGLRVIALGDK